MSPSPTLRERVRADLHSGSTVVIIAAVLLAIPTAYAVGILTQNSLAGFAILVLVGILLPKAHELLSPAMTWWNDLLWTGSATGLAVGVYLLVYYGLASVVPTPLGDWNAMLAFIVVDIVGFAILRRHWTGGGQE